MNRPIKIFFYILSSIVILVLTPFSILSCSKCSLLPDVNVTATATTGNITLEVRGIPLPARGTATQYKSITFDGRLLSSTGTSGLSDFHLARTFELSENSINPRPVITRPGLKTGVWEVKLIADTWVATGTGSVNKDGTRVFVFTYNSPQVETR